MVGHGEMITPVAYSPLNGAPMPPKGPTPNKGFNRRKQLLKVIEAQDVMFEFTKDSTLTAKERIAAARVYADLNERASDLAGVPKPGSLRPDSGRTKRRGSSGPSHAPAPQPVVNCGVQSPAQVEPATPPVQPT